MVDVREYNDCEARSRYADWFNRLNAQAAAKVTTALTRLGQGEFLERQGCRFRRVRVPHRFRPRLPGVFRQLTENGW